MSLAHWFKNMLAPAVESEQLADSARSNLPTDTAGPMRFGMRVLAAGFGGFLLWSLLAPLDEGVPCPGQVSLDTKRKSVQHPQGGIVREIFVREGQAVKFDDVLIRLDDAAARANYETIRQHYLTLRATEGRLLAEQTGQAAIAFHDDLRSAGDDALVKQYMASQNLLFQSRRSALQAELAGIRESIQGAEAQLASYSDTLQFRRTQQKLIQEELGGMKELVAEGYAPRTKQLELERMAAETGSAIADLQGNIARTRSSIAELKQRTLQRQQEYRKEVDTQLADVQREVEADGKKFAAARDELNRTQIRSPADGQVVGLAVQTPGGVIQAGQRLMDVVPENESLVIEAKVAPNMIDRIHAGLNADIRFTSFANSPQLVVEGQVDSVSGDLLTDQSNQQTSVSYYLARISVTPHGRDVLGKRQLQAGMPAEVIVKTGERTVLTYLLHPLTKRIAAAMKEE